MGSQIETRAEPTDAAAASLGQIVALGSTPLLEWSAYFYAYSTEGGKGGGISQF
jgi:hypothetical protein